MLRDLRNFQYLGSPKYFKELFDTIVESKKTNWTKDDIDILFFNKVIDGVGVIDGGVKLVTKLGILKYNGNSYTLDKSFTKCLKNIDLMKLKIVDIFFSKFVNDECFIEIFNEQNVKFDILNNAIQVSNSAFGFKLSNIKQFLIDFNVIVNHPYTEFHDFLISRKYNDIVEKALVYTKSNKKITLDEFNKNLELLKLHGEEAEEFVFNFEIQRLSNKSGIKWVAKFIVNEGFDIASFNKEADINLNRFIEVKSFGGDLPYFYWSKNERKVAKQKGDSYWLYLVSRDKLSLGNYVPIMIQNPIKLLSGNSKWQKTVETYKFNYLS